MDKKILFTCDIERDWGGRANSTQGLDEGLPRILDTFADYKIKAIFFISTEILDTHPMIPSDILGMGHTLGSHGHFHMKFKDPLRAEQDRRISNAFLQANKKLAHIPYRAPKFSYRPQGERYAHPLNHVSLLKYSWGLTGIPEEPIFYLHPFDLVDHVTEAPNLFCKLLYSRPKVVRNYFEMLCGLYS